MPDFFHLDEYAVTLDQYQDPRPVLEVHADSRAPLMLFTDCAADDGPTWQDQANCLGVEPDLFFPERGEPTKHAKAVCEGCVVKAECLEFALVNGEKHGIWGGKSERERRRLRRERAQAAAL